MNTLRMAGCVTVAVLMGSVANGAEPGLLESVNWELIWSDEFDGDDLDPAKWNWVEGGGGYGNNESQFYTGESGNLRVQDGRLVIAAREQERAGHEYTSAKITTEGKGEWTYGRFDIRARLPRGQGIWPAIWMMPSDMERYGGWPSCGEIDIMELVGHAPSTVYGTLHYGNPWQNSGGAFSLEGDSSFADHFHDFTLVWAPGNFSWFVDGEPSHSETNWYTSAAAARWPAPFDRAFYLQLNVAVGGGWPGYPDDSTEFPQNMVVEHVRVYRYLHDYPPIPDRSAEPAPIIERDPLPDGNLVYNGDFNDGMGQWEFGTFEGGEGSASATESALAVEVETPGVQSWALQVIQRPVAMMRDQPYRMTFRARSDRPRTLEVNVGKASQPWDSYSGKRTFPLDESWKTYDFAFTMRRVSNPVARLEFNAGAQDGSIWIDDVSLYPNGIAAPIAAVVEGPIRIEAEAYRTAEGIDTETCAEGGSNVGWIDAGDVLTYWLDVKKPGPYRLGFRYAGESAQGRIRIDVNGQEAARVALPATGGWQTWTTATAPVTLASGEITLKLVAEASGFNLNWLSLTPEP